MTRQGIRIRGPKKTDPEKKQEGSEGAGPTWYLYALQIMHS